MKKTLKICAVGGALLGGVLALSACGDDVTKVTNVTGDTGMEIAKSADDFEKCDSASIGKLMFASDENAAYICADSGWTPLSENSAVGCSAKMLSDSSGYKIICGEDSVGVILNGETGAAGKNGTSCSVELLSDSTGYKVVCGEDSVGVILNGADGAQGKQGEGCSLSDDGNGTITQVCGGDTVTLYKAFCGGKAYNPIKQICYSEKLFEKLDDTRDGKTYRIVTIGTQTWMAENLNYAYPMLTITEESEDPDEEPVVTQNPISFCYKNDPSNCEKTGRLYTWAAAMDSTGLASGDTANANKCGYNVSCSAKSPVRGVCPEGWHLPDETEWNALEKFVADSLFGGDASMVGNALKSTSGWYENRNGSDYFGFGAIPAGYGDIDYGDDDYDGYPADTYFWSSTESGEGYAYVMGLSYEEAYMGVDTDDKYYAQSVRCVKDAATED